MCSLPSKGFLFVKLWFQKATGQCYNTTPIEGLTPSNSVQVSSCCCRMPSNLSCSAATLADAASQSCKGSRAHTVVDLHFRLVACARSLCHKLSSAPSFHSCWWQALPAFWQRAVWQLCMHSMHLCAPPKVSLLHAATKFNHQAAQ